MGRDRLLVQVDRFFEFVFYLSRKGLLKQLLRVTFVFFVSFTLDEKILDIHKDLANGFQPFAPIDR